MKNDKGSFTCQAANWLHKQDIKINRMEKWIIIYMLQCIIRYC